MKRKALLKEIMNQKTKDIILIILILLLGIMAMYYYWKASHCVVAVY